MKSAARAVVLALLVATAGAVQGVARQMEVPLSTEADEAIEAALLEAHPDYDAEAVEIFGRPAGYVYARVDLDGDGADEVLAYLLGPFFCGTGGCSLALLQREGDALVVRQTFPISRLPITVLDATSQGWHDLLRQESGGGASASLVRHAFDEDRYVEVERIPVATAPTGRLVLTGEANIEHAPPLRPREQ